MESRQQMAQTIRQPAYTALMVDSMDRYPQGFPDSIDHVTSSSQWQLNANNYALNGYFTRVALTQVQFVWSLPTIIAGYNDSLSFTNASGSYSATIPQGFYSCSMLSNAIAGAVNAAAGSTLLTSSTVGDGGNLIFTTASSNFLFDAPHTYGTSAEGRFFQTSGILPNYPMTPNSSGTIYTLTNAPPSLLPTRYIDITSKYLTKFQRVKDTTTLIVNNSQNILARVYAFASGGSIAYPFPPSSADASGNIIWTAPRPFVINQEFTNAKQLHWNPEEAISNFDITLYDEYGSLVPWTPQIGSEYQFTLLCSET